MIEHQFSIYEDSTTLWKEYVALDYGRNNLDVYRGYKGFLKDVTGAVAVKGEPLKGRFVLEFDSEEQYTMFLLRWCAKVPADGV